MKIKQVSVFVENQPGRLLAMLQALEKSGINIHALSVSETAEFGIVRMVLADADSGAEALRQAGYTTRRDWVISTEIPDTPGGLLRSVAEPLAKAGININYFYAFIQPPWAKARIVLKTDDMDKAEEILGLPS